MGDWFPGDTLTTILANQSGTAQATGNLTAASIQPGSVDSVGNATTDNSGNPSGTF